MSTLTETPRLKMECEIHLDEATGRPLWPDPVAVPLQGRRAWLNTRSYAARSKGGGQDPCRQVLYRAAQPSMVASASFPSLCCGRVSLHHISFSFLPCWGWLLLSARAGKAVWRPYVCIKEGLMIRVCIPSFLSARWESFQSDSWKLWSCILPLLSSALYLLQILLRQSKWKVIRPIF